MSIYEILINDVIERLAGTSGAPANLALLGVEVKKLEQFKGQMTKLPTGKLGRVLVGFPMHNFGTEKEPTNMMVGTPDQESDLYISLAISARNLYDVDDNSRSLYDYLEKSQRLLLGWSSPTIGGGPLSISSAEITDYDETNQVWHYLALFRIQRFYMEAADGWEELALYDRNLAELEFIEDADEGIIVTNLDEAIEVTQFTEGVLGDSDENLIVTDDGSGIDLGDERDEILSQ